MSYVFKHQTDKKFGAFGMCCVCTFLRMLVSDKTVTKATLLLLVVCSREEILNAPGQTSLRNERHVVFSMTSQTVLVVIYRSAKGQQLS